MNNNKKFSQSPKASFSLRHLPPIDPFRIVSSSTPSQNRWPNSSRAIPKFAKPNPNQGIQLRHSEETIVRNLNLENTVVPSGTMSDTSMNTSSPSKTNSPDGGMKKGAARSKLHEVCAVNHWKPPVFDCCDTQGPPHELMFTYKVTVDTQEDSSNTIECRGSPHRKKKEAADSAAEGALWYLKQIGCVLNSEKRKNK